MCEIDRKWKYNHQAVIMLISIQRAKTVKFQFFVQLMKICNFRLIYTGNFPRQFRHAEILSDKVHNLTENGLTLLGKKCVADRY